MKKLFLSLFIFTFLFHTNAQTKTGYEIKINLKNYNDSIAYLTYYQFDKNFIADTCTKIKNGKIIFKGKNHLKTGIYSLIGQKKSILFDFFIDSQTQNINLNGDFDTNSVTNLNCSNSKLENDFFEYIKYISSKNAVLKDEILKSKGLNKKDSLALITEKQKAFNESIANYEKTFIEQNEGRYISEVVNLKMEKLLKEIPKASNGRPDSIAVFNYYKKHYWDNVNFKDDAIIRTPFFHNKLNHYFDNIINKNPDSVSVEIDKMMDKTIQGSDMNQILLAHFTSKYENPKIMGYDKVFVHIAEHYFKTGKADGLYNDENINKNIINRAALIKPLLIGNIAPDLTMIPTNNHDKIVKMGFENAKTSEELTKIYYDNIQEIEQSFLRLHSIKADYLILVFWDVDCGHCKVEIPKLLETYHDLLKEKKDIKVYAVYTQQEIDKYQKYVDENKLDWINVYDGAHTTNFKDKYDIYSTPMIYVLDKDKKIVAKRIGEDQVKEIIHQMEIADKEKIK